jgi:hypothetical protein
MRIKQESQNLLVSRVHYIASHPYPSSGAYPLLTIQWKRRNRFDMRRNKHCIALSRIFSKRSEAHASTSPHYQIEDFTHMICPNMHFGNFTLDQFAYRSRGGMWAFVMPSCVLAGPITGFTAAGFRRRSSSQLLMDVMRPPEFATLRAERTTSLA